MCLQAQSSWRTKNTFEKSRDETRLTYKEEEEEERKQGRGRKKVKKQEEEGLMHSCTEQEELEKVKCFTMCEAAAGS